MTTTTASAITDSARTPGGYPQCCRENARRATEYINTPVAEGVAQDVRGAEDDQGNLRFDFAGAPLNETPASPR